MPEVPTPSDTPRIPEVPAFPPGSGFVGGVCIVFFTGGIAICIGCFPVAVEVAVAVPVVVTVGTSTAGLVGTRRPAGTVGCVGGVVGAGAAVGVGVGVAVGVGVGVGVDVAVGVSVGGSK